MSINTAIIIYVGGVVAATFISWWLRRRVSEPIAAGVGFFVVMLTLYALPRATGSQLSFTAWAIWGVFVTVGFTILYAKLRSK